MTTIDNAAIAQQLGLSREEMIARFGEPGTKTPEEIGSALGMDHNAIVAVFGERVSSNSGDTFVSSSSNNATETSDNTYNAQKTQDDKYEEVANALGYDALSVSAVMKAVENGQASGNPENVVPQLANALGLPQTFVSNVLAYLNNGSI